MDCLFFPGRAGSSENNFDFDASKLRMLFVLSLRLELFEAQKAVSNGAKLTPLLMAEIKIGTGVLTTLVMGPVITVINPLIAGRGPPSRCSIFHFFSDFCVDVGFCSSHFRPFNKKGFNPKYV